MFQEIFDLIIKSAENAFIEVTVFVGAVLILFGYVDFKLSGKLVKKIEESKKNPTYNRLFLRPYSRMRWCYICNATIS